MKIPKAAHLRSCYLGSGDNSFETFAGSALKRLNHGMRRLSYGNDENAAVCVQVIEVLANAQNFAIATYMALERLVDAGLRKGAVEYPQSNGAHLSRLAFLSL